MTNEEAKDLLDNLIGMVEDNQNNDYDEALKLAIRSLKAWEEVLQELEERVRTYENKEFIPLTNNMYYWKTRKLGITDAIEIIVQHLAEVE